MYYSDSNRSFDNTSKALSNVMSSLLSGTDLLLGIADNLDRELSVDKINGLPNSLSLANKNRPSSESHRINDLYLSSYALSSIMNVSNNPIELK